MGSLLFGLTGDVLFFKMSLFLMAHSMGKIGQETCLPLICFYQKQLKEQNDLDTSILQLQNMGPMRCCKILEKTPRHIEKKSHYFPVKLKVEACKKQSHSLALPVIAILMLLNLKINLLPLPAGCLFAVCQEKCSLPGAAF